MQQKVPDFIGKPAPKGYIAGMSRGARGFTTEAAVGRVVETEQKPDEEAIKIFGNIDKKLKKRKREANKTEKINVPVVNIKDDLVGMSMEDWNSIPEAKNISKRKKQKITERYAAVPEHVIYRNGLDIQGNDATADQDYIDILNNALPTTDIGDVRKARELLRSVVNSNQSHAPSWIALARVEEVAKDISKARQTALRGCEKCTDNEDMWLEAVRLHPKNKAKGILGQAVRFIPKSTDIWRKASELEDNTNEKKKILRKALELLPDSLELWKDIMNLETEEQLVIPLLKQAIEAIPSGIDFYLALYSLQPYSEARVTLENGRINNPKSKLLWLNAAYLEEKNGDTDLLNAVVQSFYSSFSFSPKEWLFLSFDAELENYPNTAVSIITHCFPNISKEDAELATVKKCPLVAQYLYNALNTSTHSLELFEKEFTLLKEENKLDFLINASKYVQCEMLWLQYAKSQINHLAALDILNIAKDCINSCELYISICKIHVLLRQYQRGLEIANIGISKFIDQPRMHLKKAVLLRYTDIHKCMSYLQECISRFPKFNKFYLFMSECHSKAEDKLSIISSGIGKNPSDLLFIQQSTILERLGKLARSRAALERGRKQCPKSELLWAASSRLEMRLNKQPIALQILLKGIKLFPHSGLLWSDLIFVEEEKKRKGIVIEALNKCIDDYLVVLRCAGYYWSVDESEKAAEWYEKAIQLNPNFGDAYVEYYAFLQEKQQGKHLLDLALQNEPRYGDLFTAYSKNYKNLEITEIINKGAKWIKKGHITMHSRIVDVFIE